MAQSRRACGRLIFVFCSYLVVIAASPITAGARQELQSPQAYALSYGRLVPASTTMVTAWDIPRNPLTDTTLDGSPRGAQIRRGFTLFLQTPVEAPRFASNSLSCGNCHLNGGQRDRALPLVGVAKVFPEYNKRAGRMVSLEDRIVGCFMRSENASRAGRPHPDTASDEVVALAAYIRWLSDSVASAERIPWRGRNAIAPDSCLAIERLDPVRGKALYLANCRNCHGKNGQGVLIGDKKAGPLWGPNSWNDGAGAARIYTLAGFIRYAMPYLKPGSLSDEDSQDIAAYINSLPRPRYPFKDKDYTVTGIPRDAVYYHKRHPVARE